jgi:hypothetical protein
MAYRDFTLSDLREQFNIINVETPLFEGVESVEPSAWLVETLQRQSLSIRKTTEKAVSESTISPILSEIQTRNKHKISLFSGENLNANRQAKLNGEVDFLFVLDPSVYELTAPIICVTEAKLDEAISKSYNQVVAQMIGAQVFNQKKKQPHTTIFGAVTNGSEWHFFKIEEKKLHIDTVSYFINDLPKLIGVLQTIIDFYQ